MIAVVGLVTLSFTFANVEIQTPDKDMAVEVPSNSNAEPLGGLMADEVVK